MEYVEDLKKLGTPILIETGWKTLGYLFNNAQHFSIDTIIVSSFEGELSNECIGDEIDMDIVRDYNIIFQSKYFDHPQGKLQFTVWRKQ